MRNQNMFRGEGRRMRQRGGMRRNRCAMRNELLAETETTPLNEGQGFRTQGHAQGRGQGRGQGRRFKNID
jgi:hypothetical protein